MLDGVAHVRQREIRQEFRLGAELRAPPHQKRAERVRRTPVVVVLPWPVAADVRVFAFVALGHGVVDVQVERQPSVLVRPFHPVRQSVPRLSRAHNTREIEIYGHGPPRPYSFVSSGRRVKKKKQKKRRRFYRPIPGRKGTRETASRGYKTSTRPDRYE